MKTYTYLIVISLFLSSCSENKPEVKPEEPIPNDGLIIGDPMDCGLGDLTIFPVGCSYSPIIIEPEKEISLSNSKRIEYSDNNISFSANTNTSYMFDKSATVEYVNENQDDFDMRNLIFYNLVTKKSYPLVQDSIHILSFGFHKDFEKPLIFYRVVLEDINKDKKFNSLDPVMLYTSNLDGSSFTQITPKNEYFTDYTVYPKTNSILIKTMIDSNSDTLFLQDDETNFRMMDLNNPKFAKNIFNDSLKNQLRKFN